MSVRTLLLAMALLAPALAGCAAPEAVQGGNAATSGPPTGAASTPPGASPAPPPETTPPPPGRPPDPANPNGSPWAKLTPSVETGELPLPVAFALDGGDPEGGALTWTLDANGDLAPDARGSGLPATANYTYASAGRYTAVLTVSDGDQHATTSADVEVLGPRPESQEFEGQWPGTATAYECGYGFHPTLRSITWQEMEVLPATIGQPFRASFAFTGQSACLGVAWFGEGFIEEVGGALAESPVTGTVPDGARVARFYVVGAVDVQVSYVGGPAAA